MMFALKIEIALKFEIALKLEIALKMEFAPKQEVSGTSNKSIESVECTLHCLNKVTTQFSLKSGCFPQNDVCPQI